MQENQFLLELKSTLEKALSSNKTNNFFEVLEYAVFPPGKMFRPAIFWALINDLHPGRVVEQNTLSFGVFLELHHNYTLVHDDLPCMDDDQYRRGRLSVHARFGQWQAVLGGDALLNLSYDFLGRVEHKNAYQLRKFASWSMGARGLIFGQYLDLQNFAGNDFMNHIRVHELKTSRLIVLSLMGAYYLAVRQDLNLFKDIFRLGQAIGVVFQLQDDWQDYTQGEKGREFETNLFHLNEKKAQCYLQRLRERIDEIVQRNHFVQLDKCLKSFHLL